MPELATQSEQSVSPETSTGTSVDFWFDPLCPWAWITSRWIKEVENVRDVHVSFHPMSLGYLNRDQENPDAERNPEYWGMARVSAAAAAAYGEQVLDSLYTELGTRIHNEGRGRGREVAEEALVAAGLPADLADAMESGEHDEALIASHVAGIELVGDDVGTPILAFDGHAIFGPVASSILRGEQAGRLWDASQVLATTDDFFELKRSRTAKPSFA